MPGKNVLLLQKKKNRMDLLAGACNVLLRPAINNPPKSLLGPTHSPPACLPHPPPPPCNSSLLLFCTDMSGVIRLQVLWAFAKFSLVTKLN